MSGTTLVWAQDNNFEFSDFINALLNNEYLLESLRLTQLAEDTSNTGDYDKAIEYAKEAIRYARLSDEYVAQQMKIRGVADAIAAAQSRMEWADSVNAAEHYPDEYEDAQAAYDEALTARSGENWDEAIEAALRVMDILSFVPDVPLLAAQYLVRTWNPLKDCLWNIAAKPQVYGDPLKWTVLYNANKEKLAQPENPDLIYPGTILDIPSVNGEIRRGLLVE